MSIYDTLFEQRHGRKTENHEMLCFLRGATWEAEQAKRRQRAEAIQRQMPVAQAQVDKSWPLASPSYRLEVAKGVAALLADRERVAAERAALTATLDGERISEREARVHRELGVAA